MNINLGWVALRMFIECRSTEHYGIGHNDIQHTNKKVTLSIKYHGVPKKMCTNCR